MCKNSCKCCVCFSFPFALLNCTNCAILKSKEHLFFLFTTHLSSPFPPSVSPSVRQSVRQCVVRRTVTWRVGPSAERNGERSTSLINGMVCVWCLSAHSIQSVRRCAYTWTWTAEGTERRRGESAIWGITGTGTGVQLASSSGWTNGRVRWWSWARGSLVKWWTRKRVKGPPMGFLFRSSPSLAVTAVRHSCNSGHAGSRQLSLTRHRPADQYPIKAASRPSSIHHQDTQRIIEQPQSLFFRPAPPQFKASKMIFLIRRIIRKSRRERKDEERNHD